MLRFHVKLNTLVETFVLVQMSLQLKVTVASIIIVINDELIRCKMWS